MTDRYAVFGNPIGHSRSPRIHAAFAEQTGEAIDYTAIEAPIADFAAAWGAFVEAGGSEVVLKCCMNLVLTGNPGTGKTTFSRLLFRFLHAYGILPRDVFVEKNALELKGQYVGQTTPQVKDAVAQAIEAKWTSHREIPTAFSRMHRQFCTGAQPRDRATKIKAVLEGLCKT